MTREERLKALFDELERDAYNAEYHNYYYKEANQIIRKHFELSLPPAEGAEAILKEGLDDGRYADIVDGINIDVKQPFYQAIIRYAEDVVAAQPQPKLDPKKVQWSGYGELGNISQKPLQPTAEGAEEILESIVESLGEPINIHNHIFEIRPYTVEHKTEWWIFHKEVGSGEPLAQWLSKFATLHAQQVAEKMVEKMSPSNEQIHEAALAWAKEHSEAPDKDCPDWLIRDYEAGAYFVRQCYGCWNKTDEYYDKQLLRFIKWLRYRNFTDDTMRDGDWLELYRSDPEINE